MQMQTKAAALAVFVMLAACGRMTDAPQIEPHWSCDGTEFAVQETDGGVTLHLPGRTAELAAVEGESRAFRGDDVAVTFGDESAVLELDGTRHACEVKRWDGVPWAEARARGASFRALGQEPGWYLEVVPGGEMTVVLDYGDRTFTLPAPEPTVLDGGARGYEAAQRAGGPILVVVEPLVCFDGMSGHVFPETVTVAVGEDRYRGCGVSFKD
ncbi:MAG: hypothetical protein LC632_08475 [Xanthomonadaceae bacterium]|nr:hypothetical protein [Xanthomonadaceae bacterium]